MVAVAMDDSERQQLRVELNALFDERERLHKTASPIADRADHQRRLTEFYQRLLRDLNKRSQARPPKRHDTG